MTKPVIPKTQLGRNITQHLYTGAKQDMHTRLVYLDSRVYDPTDPYSINPIRLI